ncbi:Ozone-responsive stress related protein [Quillaja saponaria]|uniref:Ozone-responsive stress related protein n=1 Tax=Quillaja saponaria TaxID=32244 RepID=A0AAD7VE20_QUISA|nr:Ozone-responsive stress related protein [Quillaja saponaria]
MAAKIITAVLGSFGVAWAFDHIIADKKIFGGKLWFLELCFTSSFYSAITLLVTFFCPGTTPHTIANKDWWEETDKKFQAWPRTAGPPVVMNPISRQNFIVKAKPES